MKAFKIVEPGSNESVMGEVPLPEDNVFVKLYGARLNGEKPVADLEIGEGSLHRYAMCGQKPTVYKIVRVA